MDAATIAQIVTAVTNTLFVMVLAGGYYYTWRVSQRTLAEMKAQRMAIGRPQVIVDDDYDSLPEINIVVRNVSQGAAREITFEFSAPIESSNGFVISDLPYFKGGMDFLEVLSNVVDWSPITRRPSPRFPLRFPRPTLRSRTSPQL